MSARTYLAAQLKASLPKAWKIVPYSDALDVLNATSVVINQVRIENNSAAPIASHIVSFEVFVIDPKTDPSTRETSLDNSVDDFLHALDAIDSVLWTEAEKVGWGDPATNLAYRINLTVQTAKE